MVIFVQFGMIRECFADIVGAKATFASNGTASEIILHRATGELNSYMVRHGDMDKAYSFINTLGCLLSGEYSYNEVVVDMDTLIVYDVRSKKQITCNHIDWNLGIMR